MRKLQLASLTFALISTMGSAFASTNQEGYYGSARLSKVWQKADSMDTSLRPGIGQFVSGDDKDDFYNASLAAGYQYGNGWRTEGEYSFNKKQSTPVAQPLFQPALIITKRNRSV